MATWFRRPIIEALRAWPCSYLDDEDVAGGLLAPDIVHRQADRPRDQILDSVGIAPALLRQALENLAYRRGDELGDGIAAAAAVGHTHEVDHRIAGDLAPPVDRDRHRDDAGKGELAPVRQGALACLDDDVAVLVEAAGRHIVDDRRRPGR